MLRLATDENLNGNITRALLRRWPKLNLVRIQDSPVHRMGDPEVLAWCAQESRVMLSHDVRTLPHHAKSRIDEGIAVAGIVILSDRLSIHSALSDLFLIVEASEQYEWIDRINYLPL